VNQSIQVIAEHWPV